MQVSKRIQCLTHDIARKLVQKHYREEEIYFDLIWNEFLQTGSNLVLSKSQRSLLAKLGLHFDETRLHLFSPFVIVTIKAVLSEAGSFGRSPGLPQFYNAIERAATEFGAEPSLAAQLANKLAPDLLALFQNLAEVPAKKELLIDQPEAAPYGYVYADWLFNDDYKCGQKITNEVVRQLLKKNVPKCTFAVDETQGWLQLWINGEIAPLDKKHFEKAPAALWLVMTHVGRSIPFTKIRDLFAIPAGDKNKENEVYLPRNQLKRFFGDNWNDSLMQESPGTEKYPVKEKGWTFYWFRLNRNPRFSELIYSYKKKGRLIGLDLSYYEQAMQAHQSF